MWSRVPGCPGRAKEDAAVSRYTKAAIAGIVVGLVLFAINAWLALAVILAAIAIPTIAYRMLDPSQRRRVRRVTRKQVGR